MKQKSLRQLAKELGVSHSYLSQIQHGKRPASQKVVSKLVSKLVSNGKHYFLDTDTQNSYNNHSWQRSSVVEQRTHKPLVVGSNPSAATYLIILSQQRL